MKNLIAYRNPNTWTNILSVFISLTFMIVWLPFIRSIFDGESYEWGTNYFGLNVHGAGISLSILFLVAQLVFYVILMVGMYRMKNRKIYGSLLFLWWVNVFGNLLFDILKNGDTMFHGDTLNVHLSITSIVVPLAVIALLLVIQVIRTETMPVEHPWTTRNHRLLQVFLLTMPVLFVLLFSGEPHGLSDQIGVILAIAQCFYIPVIFRPYGLVMTPAPATN